MPKGPPKELPQKYYLDYYRYILKYVLKHYTTALKKPELAFIQQFQEISEDAQCLYLRIAGRRNIFFRPSQLNYEEILDFERALKELLQKDFIKNLQTEHAVYRIDLLQSYTKALLQKAAKNLIEQPNSLKQLKKEQLIELLEEEVSFEEIIQFFNEQEMVIVQDQLENELLVRFLFFGNLHGSTTDFVIRDIGYRNFEHSDDQDFTPFFNNRTEINECLKLALLSQEFYHLQEWEDGQEIMLWFENWFEPYYEWSQIAQARLDKLLVKAGRFLEKIKEPEAALEIYPYTLHPPSRERQARIWHKLKDTPKALALCQEIQDQPFNAKELIFAQDFSNRINKKQKVKSTRKELNQSEKVMLPPDPELSVEMSVLKHYVDQGYDGVFAENQIWRGLFGLIFWDLLYDPESSALHHPLQYLPSDLYQPHFYEKRQDQIEKCLRILDRPQRFEKHVHLLFEQKWGISNRLVSWNYDLLEALLNCRRLIKPSALKSVLIKMCENFKHNSAGFPDLFVWKEKDYYFVEVKSPNDMLSEQQLFWLHFFEKKKIKAKVLRVVWEEEAPTD